MQYDSLVLNSTPGASNISAHEVLPQETPLSALPLWLGQPELRPACVQTEKQARACSCRLAVWTPILTLVFPPRSFQSF